MRSENLLENLLNKKVRISVLFNQDGYYCSKPAYYKGMIIEYNDDFLLLKEGILIAIKYIQTIEIL